MEEKRAGRKQWKRRLTFGHGQEGEQKEKQDGKELLLDAGHGRQDEGLKKLAPV